MSVEIPISVILYAQIPKILRGEEVDITPIIESQVNKMILNSLLSTLTIPTEFQDIVNLMITLEDTRATLALLRGEAYEPRIDRIIELVVNLSMIESIATALGTAT